MSTETTSTTPPTNGAAGAPESAGGEAAVNALFSGSAETGTPASDPAPGADGVMPPQFRNEDGSTNEAAILKSWTDGRAEHTRLSQKLAALEKAQAEAVPATWDTYRTTLDLDALKEKAPKVAPANDVQAQTMDMMLQAAHKAGIPVTRAHAFVHEFYGAMNEWVPDPVTQEEAMKAAVAAVPNGDVVASDVQTWLAGRARQQSFSEGQMAVIQSLLATPDGLTLLQRLSREGTTSLPPSIDRRYVDLDGQSRKEQLEKDLLTMSADDLNGPKGAKLLADFRELGGKL